MMMQTSVIDCFVLQETADVKLDAKDKELSDARLTHAARIQTMEEGRLTEIQCKVTDATAAHSAALKAKDDALNDEKFRSQTEQDKVVAELQSEKSKAAKLESDIKKLESNAADAEERHAELQSSSEKSKAAKLESDLKDSEKSLEKANADITTLKSNAADAGNIHDAALKAKDDALNDEKARAQTVLDKVVEELHKKRNKILGLKVKLVLFTLFLYLSLSLSLHTKCVVKCFSVFFAGSDCKRT